MDITNGMIIGDSHKIWALFYDNRQQGQAIWEDVSTDDDDIIRAAKERIKALTDEWASYPTYLYQDSSRWEVRIW